MSDIILIFVKAFLVGGAICCIAQLLINYTKITSGKILVYFMLSGILLQSFGLYQYLVDFAGAVAPVVFDALFQILDKLRVGVFDRFHL